MEISSLGFPCDNAAPTGGVPGWHDAGVSAPRPLPSYDEVLALPAAPTRVVPPEYGDGNGHLNVRHYLGILDDAEWVLFDEFGAGNEASSAGTGGMFALEQLLTYRCEVLVGDEVAVHLRLVARSEKLIHLVSYLVNHTRREVAASMEALEAYVAYETRRVSPFSPAAQQVLDHWIRQQAPLPAPVLSGAISL
jgi:acyl-CoA thioester hydrolase